MNIRTPEAPPQSDARRPFRRRPLFGRLRKMLVAAATGFLLGFILWATARPLTGKEEPWDTAYPLYSVSMVVGGLVIGYLAPGRFTMAVAGTWLGQITALGVVPWLAAGGWFPLGAVTTAIGSLLILPGMFVGSVIGFLVARWSG